MKRVTIFAHYDKQNIVDPYVITYLTELKKYSEIIFVSYCNLKEQEIKKIENLCFDNIYKKHGEYDFGSYKFGFQLLQNKYSDKFNKLDEVLFVNDSCYLIGPFDKVFIQMEQKLEIDCWGLSDDYVDRGKYYLASYFLSFRRSVFLDKNFQNFINNINNQDKDDVIIKYEFGLSEFLINNNKKLFAIFGSSEIIHFLADNFLNISAEIENLLIKNSFFTKRKIIKIVRKVFGIVEANNSTNYIHSDKFYFFIRNNFPLLKRRIIESGFLPKSILLFFWQEILKKANSMALKEIKTHCNRIGLGLKNSDIFSSKIKYLKYHIGLIKLFYIKDIIKNGKKTTLVKILFIKFRI